MRSARLALSQNCDFRQQSDERTSDVVSKPKATKHRPKDTEKSEKTKIEKSGSNRNCKRSDFRYEAHNNENGTIKYWHHKQTGIKSRPIKLLKHPIEHIERKILLTYLLGFVFKLIAIITGPVVVLLVWLIALPFVYSRRILWFVLNLEFLFDARIKTNNGSWSYQTSFDDNRTTKLNDHPKQGHGACSTGQHNGVGRLNSDDQMHWNYCPLNHVETYWLRTKLINHIIVVLDNSTEFDTDNKDAPTTGEANQHLFINRLRSLIRSRILTKPYNRKFLSCLVAKGIPCYKSYYWKYLGLDSGQSGGGEKDENNSPSDLKSRLPSSSSQTDIQNTQQSGRPTLPSTRISTCSDADCKLAKDDFITDSADVTGSRQSTNESTSMNEFSVTSSDSVDHQQKTDQIDPNPPVHIYMPPDAEPSVLGSQRVNLENHIFIDPSLDCRQVNISTIRRHTLKLLACELDMRRPLWEIRLVNDTRKTQKFLILRCHQSLADGMALINLLTGSLTKNPMSPRVEPIVRPDQPMTGSLSLNIGQPLDDEDLDGKLDSKDEQEMNSVKQMPPEGELIDGGEAISLGQVGKPASGRTLSEKANCDSNSNNNNDDDKDYNVNDGALGDKILTDLLEQKQMQDNEEKEEEERDYLLLPTKQKLSFIAKMSWSDAWKSAIFVGPLTVLLWIIWAFTRRKNNHLNRHKESQQENQNGRKRKVPVKESNRFYTASYDLTKLHQVKQLTRSTVSDVILCCLSGALREYLRKFNAVSNPPNLNVSLTVDMRNPEKDERRQLACHRSGYYCCWCCRRRRSPRLCCSPTCRQGRMARDSCVEHGCEDCKSELAGGETGAMGDRTSCERSQTNLEHWSHHDSNKSDAALNDTGDSSSSCGGGTNTEPEVRCTLVNVPIPTSVEGTVPRLWEIRNTMDELRTSADPWVMLGLQRLLFAVLPVAWYQWTLNYLVLGNSSVLLSNIRGPSNVAASWCVDLLQRAIYESRLPPRLFEADSLSDRTLALRRRRLEAKRRRNVLDRRLRMRAGLGQIAAIYYCMQPATGAVPISFNCITYLDRLFVSSLSSSLLVEDSRLLIRLFFNQLDQLANTIAKRRSLVTIVRAPIEICCRSASPDVEKGEKGALRCQKESSRSDTDLEGQDERDLVESEQVARRRHDIVGSFKRDKLARGIFGTFRDEHQSPDHQTDIQVNEKSDKKGFSQQREQLAPELESPRHKDDLEAAIGQDGRVDRCFGCHRLSCVCKRRRSLFSGLSEQGCSISVLQYLKPSQLRKSKSRDAYGQPPGSSSAANAHGCTCLNEGSNKFGQVQQRDNKLRSEFEFEAAQQEQGELPSDEAAGSRTPRDLGQSILGQRRCLKCRPDYQSESEAARSMVSLDTRLEDEWLLGRDGNTGLASSNQEECRSKCSINLEAELARDRSRRRHQGGSSSILVDCPPGSMVRISPQATKATSGRLSGSPDSRHSDIGTHSKSETDLMRRPIERHRSGKAANFNKKARNRDHWFPAIGRRRDRDRDRELSMFSGALESSPAHQWKPSSHYPEGGGPLRPSWSRQIIGSPFELITRHLTGSAGGTGSSGSITCNTTSWPHNQSIHRRRSVATGEGNIRSIVIKDEVNADVSLRYELDGQFMGIRSQRFTALGAQRRRSLIPFGLIQGPGLPRSLKDGNESHL